MSILEVSAISKRFGGLQAVDNVSFSADRREILGLIGPNGSGKSTTLSLTMGVARPDSGSVKLAGREIAGKPTHTIAKAGIAMVFQHSRPLRRQTVLENIKLALLPDSLFQMTSGKHINAKAREAAERVGLGDVLHEHPDSMPFANLRRLEVAKALACDPDVILFDEPFAGLAPSETREFSDLIVSLRDTGCAVVLVDHNVKAVAGLVDRIAAMDAGKKIAEGTPDEVTNDEQVREVYFGTSLEAVAQPRAVEQQHAPERLLEVNLESVHYHQAQALRDISLDVNETEFVSVVGLNGAGKTTLLESILGFVSYAGDIRWESQSLSGHNPAMIANRGIALCPETRELFTHMTVRENLEMGGHTMASENRKAQIEWVFELFPRLHERAGQSAHTLSGGEQQMLTIGRALMQKPRLLILDEPTLGLAPLVIEDISEVLDRLQEQGGMTVLLAEQNLTFALKHSHRLYLLETGSLRWSGRSGDFENEVGADIL